MPFQEQSIMSQREEFARLASQAGANIAELCRRYGISRFTGYKWLRRYEAQPDGKTWMANRSRRPHTSPGQTAEIIEAAVIAVRRAHPAWGGRKIRHVLLSDGLAAPSA